MEHGEVDGGRPRRRLELAATVALGVVLLAGVLIARGGRDRAPPTAVPGDVVLSTERILVEVINTTRQRGLARRATFFLRDEGFDVVRYASGSPPRDSTQVIDRSGHLERAERVARALGVPHVVVQLDSARYLDVTVLLGSDWRPPAKPFYP